MVLWEEEGALETKCELSPKEGKGRELRERHSPKRMVPRKRLGKEHPIQ